jgi:thioredoxin reductase (NADPH)
VLILGAGPAAYSAAVQAARTNLQPVLVTTTDVANWPGDPLGEQGSELMERLRQVAERFDTTIVIDHFHTAHLREKPIRLVGDSKTYTCDALIIAAGAPARYPGLNVLVVGGGNTALEVALCLSNIAGKVTLMHRRDRLRAEPIQIDRLAAKVAEGRIALSLNRLRHEVAGDGRQVIG